MASFGLDTASLVAAALRPAEHEPKYKPKLFTPAPPPLPTVVAEPKAKRKNKASDPSKRRSNKRGNRSGKHKSKKRARSSTFPDNGVDHSSDSDEPQPPKKRKRNARNSMSNVAIDDDDDLASALVNVRTPSSGSSQSLFAPETSTSPAVDIADSRHETYSATTTSRRSKVKPLPVAKTFEHATPADRMMFRMKNENKSWQEIRQAWTELTGVRPAKSTLSVRYIKLKQNLAMAGGADDIRLLKFKKEVEAELKDEIWERIATKILQDGGQRYTPVALQHRFTHLEATDFQLHSVPEIQEDQREGEVAQEEDVYPLDPALTGTEYDAEAEDMMDVDETGMDYTMSPHMHLRNEYDEKDEKEFKNDDEKRDEEEEVKDVEKKEEEEEVNDEDYLGDVSGEVAVETVEQEDYWTRNSEEDRYESDN